MPRPSREEWKTYKNVFDEYTLRNLFKLETQGHLARLESPIAIGKESNVFTAVRADATRIIVKIYRLETCDFNQMYAYLRTDPRYEGISNQRRKVIFAWTAREYRNLMRAREVIRVPTPLVVRDNILLLELIGQPAPRLKDAPPADAQAFYAETVEMMRRLWHHGLVHGDLSAFNILNDEDRPVFIDFSQSTATDDTYANELLERDCTNIAAHFFKLGVETSSEAIKTAILAPAAQDPKPSRG